MWEISNGSQMAGFLYSLILGLILAVFYDFQRAFVVVAKKGRVFVFFTDMFFWIVSAILTFFFLLGVTYGEIRGYIIVGIFLGFVLFKITLSRILLKPLMKLFCFLKSVLCCIRKIILKTFRFFKVTFNNVNLFMSKIIGNSVFGLKKLLKSSYNMMYTKLNKDKKTTENSES